MNSAVDICSRLGYNSIMAEVLHCGARALTPNCSKRVGVQELLAACFGWGSRFCTGAGRLLKFALVFALAQVPQGFALDKVLHWRKAPTPVSKCSLTAPNRCMHQSSAHQNSACTNLGQVLCCTATLTRLWFFGHSYKRLQVNA